MPPRTSLRPAPAPAAEGLICHAPLLKRREEYRRKQERLRHAIQEGIKDFAKGDFITLKDDKELNNFFASL